ncbi:membrane hypothetical protein [Syntrophobacter sp. SbD1]|nr:membrane hypothetical protein [Syntrophobacter sp. SbD1]
MEGEELLKHYRKTGLILFFGLTVITVLSCLHTTPQGPFDARDYTRIAGMRVEFHPWEALFEPLASPFLIPAGSPDFQVSCGIMIVWVLLAAAAWGMFAEFRAGRQNRSLRIWPILLKGIRSALVTGSTLMLIICLFVAGRIPGWRLVVDDPDLIVADLHCHTTKSPDALVTLKTNLKWHASCGYNVAALTEHNQLFAHETLMGADSSFDRLPAFISGLEAHTGPRTMLLGLCRDPQIPFEKQKVDEYPDRSAWFSNKIHEECGGAVIGLTLKRLAPGDIARLVDDGVDGFEIANSGHPEMGPDLRREVLDTCRARGIPLVASTDWHGWTGMSRAWTVIRAPGSSALSRSERANLVIRKLREHDSADIIPVVAGYMGDASLAHSIFSPIVETLRYAQELSAARVISWWIWTWAIFALWVFLYRIGIAPGGFLLGLLTCAVGLGLIAAGISLIGQGIVSAASYPIHFGLLPLGLGAGVLGYSIFSLVTLLRLRGGLRGHESPLSGS